MAEYEIPGKEAVPDGRVWDFEPIDASLDHLDDLREELARATGRPVAAWANGLPPTELETLSWSLLDGTIDRDQMERFETLLRADDVAVKTYVECALLHADLHQFFAPPPNQGLA